MAEEYDFEKLAREIVNARLTGKQPAEAPLIGAATVKEMLVSGVQGTRLHQEPRATVHAVCHGALNGVMLAGGSLPETAVLLLAEVAAIADATALSSQDLMTWSMEGIAEGSQTAGAEVQSKIQDAIEARYMGAGTVFGHICHDLSRSP